MTSKTGCPPYNLLGNLFWGGLVFCWYFKKIYFAKTLVLRIVCRTRARGTYGPTVKNLTLTFWPKIFSWPVHMYRKSPRKFERKFQCKIFHGRPLFVEVPKIRTSPNASFWLIWTNWDMKEMEMWPKAIMVWKYDGFKTNSAKNFGSVITWARDMICLQKRIAEISVFFSEISFVSCMINQ